MANCASGGYACLTVSKRVLALALLVPCLACQGFALRSLPTLAPPYAPPSGGQNANTVDTAGAVIARPLTLAPANAVAVAGTFRMSALFSNTAQAAWQGCDVCIATAGICGAAEWRPAHLDADGTCT